MLSIGARDKRFLRGYVKGCFGRGTGMGGSWEVIGPVFNELSGGPEWKGF